ncbi:MAG: hypothetical protein OEW59_05175 [Gammaproteobacteria bacterium]|nr:hypothetical protein [Gammaproteobacteria bacterium]
MRFVEWLRNKVGREAAEPEPRYHPPRVRVRPAPARAGRKPKKIDFSGDVGGKLEDGGPGKNVLVRNKYVREDTGTHETLMIVDDSLLEPLDESGADPYNTGRFDRSKSWDSFRNRK